MSSPPFRVLYLHGFASSPQSRKARFFAEHLPSLGLETDILDLAQGDFEHLTLTSQLDVIHRAARGERVVLIGSSLGGYLASVYASLHTEVERLVLLAPAFNLASLWEAEMGPARVEEWREKRALPVYHYGLGRHT